MEHLFFVPDKVEIVYTLKDFSNFPSTLKLMCYSYTSLDLLKIITSQFGAILTCMRFTK